MLEVAGWIVVVGLIVSTAYSSINRRLVYVVMATRARFNRDTGEVEDEPLNPIAEQLARRYMWNTIAMQCFKVVLAVVMINWLLR